MRYLDAVYVRSNQEAMDMLRKLEADYEASPHEAFYIGLDTETRPGEGGVPEDALRWWGENPGVPFLYIVGWSPNFGDEPCRFYAIPEEYDWAFSRIVDFANEHTKGAKPIEWPMYNRTFDLGMVEYSAGFKILGTSHEVFTVLRTACFIPDWWDDMRLKSISEKFLDPRASEPMDRKNMFEAHYNSNREKTLTKMLRDVKFSKKALKHYQDNNMPVPFHVEQVIKQWKQDCPAFTYAHLPDDILIPYALNDVYLTLWLFFVGMKMIRERGTMDTYDREQELYLNNIREQTINGWAIDREELGKAKTIAEGRLAELKEYLFTHMGWDTCRAISDEVRVKGFNPGSNDQMMKLFRHIGLDVENLQAVTLLKHVVRAFDGVRTPWADVIEKYQDYKLYAKLYGTYICPILEASKHDGLCHPSIRQDRAYTGRQAMQNPPLQTIPRKEVPEFHIRQFFKARSSEYRLWLADYSGMEVTMFAEYCRDPVMLDALAKGADFHSMLSLKAFRPARELVLAAMYEMKIENMMFHVEQLQNNHVVDHQLLEEIKTYMEAHMGKEYKKYKRYRQAAKVGMFAILYGAGPDALSEQMTEESGIYISKQEATEFKQSFYRLYLKGYGFTQYVAESISMRHALHTIYNQGRTYGWIRNMYGRLYLMEGRDAYKGVNYVVQGSCADLLKKKIIKISRLLKDGNYKSMLILSIHDELVFELHKSEERELVPIIKAIMEDNPEFEAVKLRADVSFCSGTWVTKKTFDGDWGKVS